MLEYCPTDSEWVESETRLPDPQASIIHPKKKEGTPRNQIWDLDV